MADTGCVGLQRERDGKEAMQHPADPAAERSRAGKTIITTKTKRRQAHVLFPSPSELLPGWEWIHALSEPLLPVSQHRLQRGCTQPGAGCNWSLLRIWGALVEPRLPRGRRLLLSPPPSAARCRPALRLAPAPAEAARSGPVHPGGSGPIPPPAARKEQPCRTSWTGLCLCT